VESRVCRFPLIDRIHVERSAPFVRRLSERCGVMSRISPAAGALLPGNPDPRREAEVDRPLGFIETIDSVPTFLLPAASLRI